jgi:predicted nucleic acid-binding protein
MISAVADSGPLMHVALVGQIALLPRYAHPILIVPQVYAEVVTQGAGKPGAQELAAACQAGVVQIREVIDQQLISRVRQASPLAMSDVDVMVVALAIEQQAALLSDDAAVRTLAVGQGLSVIGSVGVLTRARLDGIIPALKPLLDQLVASGFHLDPHGQVYQDAVRRVGEA